MQIDPQLAIIAISAFLLGVLIVVLVLLPKYFRSQKAVAELTTTLSYERKYSEEKIKSIEEARQRLNETFSLLSSQALKHNSEEFLKLAQENLKQFQASAQNNFEQKEKAIEHLLKPIKDALDKTETQIQAIEKDRKHAYGALEQHLTIMAQTQTALQNETRNLVQAFRRPEVRGQWGELTLKRLVELAGMVEYCDFFEQENVNTESGKQRPDMLVRMPAGREIVVDVKTPLDAYLTATEATDETEKQQALIRHARNVKQRINELSSKAYWNQLERTPDFVVLFIPGDQFLTAALDIDHNLVEDALSKQVVLATPTSLVALLRAIAYGWRQEQLTQNADEIRNIGEELYDRLATFADHLSKLGRSLDNSMKHFNQAVGSFDSRIIPSVRKFNELGIQTNKTMSSPEQIETAPRTLESAVDVD